MFLGSEYRPLIESTSIQFVISFVIAILILTTLIITMFATCIDPNELCPDPKIQEKKIE